MKRLYYRKSIQDYDEQPSGNTLIDELVDNVSLNISNFGFESSWEDEVDSTGYRIVVVTALSS